MCCDLETEPFYHQQILAYESIRILSIGYNMSNQAFGTLDILESLLSLPPPTWQIQKICSFVPFFHWACLCLTSFSVPDAFLDILSQEIIRFFTPSGYQSRAHIWCGTVGRDLIIQQQCRRVSDSPIYLHIAAQHIFIPLPSAKPKLCYAAVMYCIPCQNSSVVKGGCCDGKCKTQVQNWGGTRLPSVLTMLKNLKPSKHREEAKRDICSSWKTIFTIKSKAHKKNTKYEIYIKLTWSTSHIHVFLKVSLRKKNTIYIILSVQIQCKLNT